MRVLRGKSSENQSDAKLVSNSFLIVSCENIHCKIQENVSYFQPARFSNKRCPLILATISREYFVIKLIVYDQCFDVYDFYNEHEISNIHNE